MATTCWRAGGHRDAYQSKTLWLSLCNDLKQGMTMTEGNNVISSMWHQQQIQTGSQDLGKGGEWKCLWTTSVAWLFLSCPRLLKGELPVLHSPKPSVVNISDDDDNRKPKWSLKWLCNLLTWICVVCKCGWASTREREKVRAHENVCEWAQARVAGQCTPMLKKALSLCHLTHKKLHRQLVSWNSLSYHQVNIADAF